MRDWGENAAQRSIVRQGGTTIQRRLLLRQRYSPKLALGAAPHQAEAGFLNSISKDFLAEAGEDEFDAEERGAIVFVENGIDLDDFEGNHGLGVGDHFHGEMGFAIGDTAAHGSADAGSVGGIDEVHIEADGDAGGVVHGVLEGVGHDFAHAALVDVAHGEDVDAGYLDDLSFLGVEIAGTDDDDVAGLGFGLEAEKVDEFGRPVTHDDG